MIATFALWSALLADPVLTVDESLRACLLVQHASAASTDNAPAPLLLAIAWREDRFKTADDHGPMCGSMQVQALQRAGQPWGLTCQELAQPQVGMLAGAAVLRDKLRASHGDMARALQRYAGCKRGCRWYSDQVLDRARAWGWRG